VLGIEIEKRRRKKRERKTRLEELMRLKAGEKTHG